MAPVPILHSPRISSRQVQHASVAPVIIIISVVVTILVFSMAAILFRVMAAKLASRTADMPPQDINDGPPLERKASDWARQNSNVLWSMYIEEDDLKSQFGRPSKPRLFSIGSVSTVDHGRCPLDRGVSNAGCDPNTPSTIEEKDKERDSMSDDAGEDGLTAQEQETTTTPSKNVSRIRAMSQPPRHRRNYSLEERAKRKQSVPAHIPIPAGEKQ